MFHPVRHYPDLNFAKSKLSPDACGEIQAQEREAAELVVTGAHPGPYESRIGGTPAWQPSRPIPADAKGKPLLFLAQIDFKTLGLPGFPDGGILQFFIASDDLYGCAFPSVSDPSRPGTDFQVIYHEDPSILRPCPNYYEGFAPYLFEHPFEANNWMGTSFKLQPQHALMSPSATCKAGEELAEILESDHDVEDAFEILDKELPDAHVGGYPIYTQGDIAYDADHAKFDTVLLSIGMPGQVVMFGDAGRANFLIRKDDLARRDFTRVAYTWDCH
jgi:uncharacterized protein YwqG